MTSNPRVTPYGSARDLPSFQELERHISTIGKFSFLLPEKSQKEVKESKRKLQFMVDTVDSFYELLGERNWVFTDDMHLEDIQHVIAAPDATTAEERLIGYYKKEKRIHFSLLRLGRLEAMRPRMELLQKALADYKEGRYYSTVLVLLSVMDGFVNELDPEARRGLHARSAEDMVAWDSVAGHHLGLGHAHQTFKKGFQKTHMDEATELFRNGIMHGAIVNFDNEVVATKAWNRLFAVVDWEESQRRRNLSTKTAPTLQESLRKSKENQAQKNRLEAWEPYEYEPRNSGADKSDVAAVCKEFLETCYVPGLIEGRKLEKETLTCPSNTPTSLNNAPSNSSSTPKPIPRPPMGPSEESLTNSASPRKPCVCGFANTKTPAWTPQHNPST